MNLRYRDERHKYAGPKQLPGINSHQEHAHTPHDLAHANTQVLLLGAVVLHSSAYLCS